MTLRTRLAKLEAKNAPALEGPRVIIFTMVWRGEDGALMTAAHFAKVKTVHGWEVVHPMEGEADDAFRTRTDAMWAKSGAKTDHQHVNIKRYAPLHHSP